MSAVAVLLIAVGCTDVLRRLTPGLWLPVALGPLIAVVVAAKSIIRFPEINAGKARENGGIGIDDVTEYFLVGASPAGSWRSAGWR